MSKTILRIGLDPDVDKSGYCLLLKKPFGKTEIVELETLDFFDVCGRVEGLFTRHSPDLFSITVFIEGGWLNKSIHHSMKNAKHGAKIGEHVGANHQIGKLFELFCKKNSYPYHLYKPSTSKWDSKIFKQVTGWDKRSNQEQRDSVRAAWV